MERPNVRLTLLLLLPRHVNFIPKTLEDYKRNIPQAYMELGKLPADVNTPELVEKRAAARRMKEFDKQLRRINKAQISRVAKTGTGKLRPKKVSDGREACASRARQQSGLFSRSLDLSISH